MAKDIFHDTVKLALQKDGWTITHDPYRLRYGIANIYIDLTATEIVIDRELVQCGIAPQDIVLGFRAPKVRERLAAALQKNIGSKP